MVQVAQGYFLGIKVEQQIYIFNQDTIYNHNLNIMNQNSERKRSCVNYLKQAVLITLILSFLVIFYSLDESILAIGSLKTNITTINTQNSTLIDCSSLCSSPYVQPLSDSQCCQDAAVQSTCKSKQECSLEILTKYQNQLNNQYTYLLLEAGIQLIIILIVSIYCIKKRMENAKKRRQTQQNRQNQHAAIFNIVGSLRIRREYDPPALESSFLYEENQHNCSICLESLLEAKAIKLKCHHIFHSQCIKEWMETRNTCPICRTKN